VLTAVCLAFSKETGKPDDTGPWMVAAPQRAIDIGTELGAKTSNPEAHAHKGDLLEGVPAGFLGSEAG
jgi:hypothetical protein